MLISSHTQGLLSPYPEFKGVYSVVDFSAFAVLVESCLCVASDCPCHNVYISMEVTLRKLGASLE